MASTLDWILVIIGQILLTIGALCDLIASIAMLRFPNFYTRLHALTLGSVGGAVVPLIGIAFIAAGSGFLGTYRYFLLGSSIVIAFIILILGGSGSHAIARATHKARAAPLQPIIRDMLTEEEAGKQ